MSCSTCLFVTLRFCVSHLISVHYLLGELKMQRSESGCQQAISCRRHRTVCVCVCVCVWRELMIYKSPGHVAAQAPCQYLFANMNLGFTAQQLRCLHLYVCDCVHTHTHTHTHTHSHTHAHIHTLTYNRCTNRLVLIITLSGIPLSGKGIPASNSTVN